jgi:hypothetical protein
MQGICKLCHQAAELQRSHLIGRALYRLCRGEGTGNQDPLTFTATEHKKSSYQVKDYLLCRPCEQRLSREGENYVMRLVTKRDNTFPLLNLLNSNPPTTKASASALYSVKDTASIDRTKIAYFALSVFWRASVHQWRDEGGEPIFINLGRRYNEEIRQYLLGNQGIPRSAYLSVIACKDPVSHHVFYFPTKHASTNQSSAGFLIRGLLFSFRITKTPNRLQVRFSMTNNPNEWILVEDRCEGRTWVSSGFQLKPRK